MITDIVEKLHWNPVEIARQLKVCCYTEKVLGFSF